MSGVSNVDGVVGGAVIQASGLVKRYGELEAVSRKWRQLPLEAMPVF